MLNGRAPRDSTGKWTSFHKGTCSVLDIALVHSQAVGDLSVLSLHGVGGFHHRAVWAMVESREVCEFPKV